MNKKNISLRTIMNSLSFKDVKKANEVLPDILNKARENYYRQKGKEISIKITPEGTSQSIVWLLKETSLTQKEVKRLEKLLIEKIRESLTNCDQL